MDPQGNKKKDYSNISNQRIISFSNLMYSKSNTTKYTDNVSHQNDKKLSSVYNQKGHTFSDRSWIDRLLTLYYSKFNT